MPRAAVFLLTSLRRAKRGEGGARNARRVGCLRTQNLWGKGICRCSELVVEHFPSAIPHPSARWASTLPALCAVEGGGVYGRPRQGRPSSCVSHHLGDEAGEVGVA